MTIDHAALALASTFEILGQTAFYQVSGQTPVPVQVLPMAPDGLDHLGPVDIIDDGRAFLVQAALLLPGAGKGDRLTWAGSAYVVRLVRPTDARGLVLRLDCSREG